MNHINPTKKTQSKESLPTKKLSRGRFGNPLLDFTTSIERVAIGPIFYAGKL